MYGVYRYADGLICGPRARTTLEIRKVRRLDVGVPGVKEGKMRTCRLCLWAVTPDDVVVELRGDRCICLRCYLRETGTDRPMPREYQRQISEALHAAA